jgi:acyl-CoA-binding protein
MSTEEEIISHFNDITNKVIEHKNNDYRISDEIKASLYKYYKQATCGDCNTSQPWMYETLKRAKWDAWNSVKGMTKLEAMSAYVDLYNIITNPC